MTALISTCPTTNAARQSSRAYITITGVGSKSTTAALAGLTNRGQATRSVTSMEDQKRLGSMKIRNEQLNASIRNIPLPDFMRELPVSKQGFPVPHFVARIAPGEEWDFRVVRRETFAECIKERLCWVCGQRLGPLKSFVVGPMCVITRTSAEPPCHYSCAQYAAIACPFLAAPRMRRNEVDLPEGHQPPAGMAIMRNPGVAAVLVTRDMELFNDGDGGVLVHMGEPERVEWYRERRKATRAEVEHSIVTGVSVLYEEAEKENAVSELVEYIAAAHKWLPAAPVVVQR